MLESKIPRSQSRSNGALREGFAPEVIRMKVVLLEVVPPIWRRFQVPAGLTLRRLHSVLQLVMGWKGPWVHQFRVAETLIGKPSEASENMKDSRWVTVEDVVSRGATAFRYELGPGGRWEHEIRIEGFAEGNPTNQHPFCLGGERACPPSDASGPDSYVDWILAARSERSELVERFDPAFDPDHFDLETVNRALNSLR